MIEGLMVVWFILFLSGILSATIGRVLEPNADSVKTRTVARKLSKLGLVLIFSALAFFVTLFTITGFVTLVIFRSYL